MIVIMSKMAKIERRHLLIIDDFVLQTLAYSQSAKIFQKAKV
jgi:hypothetical protein